jgi:hypothetical protein
MGSVSPAPSRRGGRDGGIDWLQRTTEAVKHAATANSVCGFRRSGCSGREARRGGGRARARVAQPPRFIGAGRPCREQHGHRGRGGAGLRRSPGRARGGGNTGSDGPRAGPRRADGPGQAGLQLGQVGLRDRAGPKAVKRGRLSGPQRK